MQGHSNTSMSIIGVVECGFRTDLAIDGMSRGMEERSVWNNVVGN